MWHRSVVQDLNLHGWWQSVQVPGCGVSHWSCQARPRHINRISPLGGQAGIGGPRRPFEVTGPLSPPGRGLGSDPSAHIHTCQGTNTHIFTYSCLCRHIRHARARNLLLLNQAPKKYDLPPCPANTHHRSTALNHTDISVASADKGQTGSSQSAPGSVLIKEQVAAPSRHLGMGQEKKDEVD